MKIPEEYLIYILTGLMLLFSSIVHATLSWKVARDKKDETFTFVDFLILLPLCIFSGVLFAMFTSIYFEDMRIIIISASMGSFLGIAGVQKASAIFLDLGESWLRNLLNQKK